VDLLLFSIIGVLLFAALIWFARRRRSPSHVAELVSMCRGDRGQAQRLIDGEKRRNPGISDDEAAGRAVRAWRRELR
jgi:hypothetical protein